MTEGGQEFVVKRAAKATGQGQAAEGVIKEITMKTGDGTKEKKQEVSEHAANWRKRVLRDYIAPIHPLPHARPYDPTVRPPVPPHGNRRWATNFSQSSRAATPSCPPRHPLPLRASPSPTSREGAPSRWPQCRRRRGARRASRRS